jgi:hypothetical protein
MSGIAVDSRDGCVNRLPDGVDVNGDGGFDIRRVRTNVSE